MSEAPLPAISVTGQPEPERLTTVEEIYAFAGELLQAGADQTTIYQSLVSKGVDDQQAAEVAQTMMEARREAIRSQGWRDVLWGGLWCFGGLGITAYTYAMAAQNPGGGRYFLFWGAVIFGGIQMLRGIYKVINPS